MARIMCCLVGIEQLVRFLLWMKKKAKIAVVILTAKVISAVSFVANANPDAHPNNRDHVPGVNLLFLLFFIVYPTTAQNIIAENEASNIS